MGRGDATETMTLLRKLGRQTKLRLLLLLAGLVVFACSQSGDGDDPTPATVSGFVSNQSSAMKLRPPRTFFASLFEALLPEAHAGRSGIVVSLSGIEGAETLTDAFGYFVLESPRGGSLAIRFDTGGNTFTREISAIRNGAVMLAGVSLEPDGSAPSGSSFFALNGMIIGANCGTSPRTLTLETPDAITVSIADDAEIVTSEGITCPALNDSIGESVFVQGADQGLVSSWITQSGFVPRDHAQFAATVTGKNCSISLNVTRSDGEPVLVNITAASYRRGLESCDDVPVGQEIDVIGQPRSGEFLASWIFPP